MCETVQNHCETQKSCGVAHGFPSENLIAEPQFFRPYLAHRLSLQPASLSVLRDGHIKAAKAFILLFSILFFPPSPARTAGPRAAELQLSPPVCVVLKAHTEHVLQTVQKIQSSSRCRANQQESLRSPSVPRLETAAVLSAAYSLVRLLIASSFALWCLMSKENMQTPFGTGFAAFRLVIRHFILVDVQAGNLMSQLLFSVTVNLCLHVCQ